MDEEENIDIAAAMGFGSFGGTKKRKYDQASSPKSKADASGANSTKLGVRTKKTAGPEALQAANQTEAIDADAVASSSIRTGRAPSSTIGSHSGRLYEANTNQQSTDMVSFGNFTISKAELNALKFGIQNDQGDMVYFQPNFIENPWT